MLNWERLRNAGLVWDHLGGVLRWHDLFISGPDMIGRILTDDRGIEMDVLAVGKEWSAWVASSETVFLGHN